LKIWIHIDGFDYGPFSLEDLIDSIISSEVFLTDKAWTEDWNDYKPVSKLPGLIPLLLKKLDDNPTLTETTEPTRPESENKENLTLLSWQEEAVDKWMQHNGRGIVEAVTGSGKSYLAMGCWRRLIKEFPDKKIRALVVVPTLALQNQWIDKWKVAFPEDARYVGIYNADTKDNFKEKLVIVCTIQSAVPHAPTLLAGMDTPDWKKLLIADEAHRYVNGEHFRKIRTGPYWDHALAITATLGDEIWKVPGFGEIIYEYTFSRAQDDGLIPRFDVVNCAVPLTSSERRDYKDLTEQLGDQIALIKNLYEDRLQGAQGQLFKILKQILKENPNEIPIKRMFSLIFRRATIWYMAEEKTSLARDLIIQLVNEGGRKVIVFFERIASIDEMEEYWDREDTPGNLVQTNDGTSFEEQSMNQLREQLENAEVNGWIGSIHSHLKKGEIEQQLKEFKAATHGVLLTCRMLDEGLDVPEIDAALLVSSTKSKTQRIQRFGRALRKEGKKPIIITLYIPETKEGAIIWNDEEIFKDAAVIHNVEESGVRLLIEQLLKEQENEDEEPEQEGSEHFESVDPRSYFLGRDSDKHWAYELDVSFEEKEAPLALIPILKKSSDGGRPEVPEKGQLPLYKKNLIKNFPNHEEYEITVSGNRLIPSTLVRSIGEDDVRDKLFKGLHCYIFWNGENIILWERQPKSAEYHWKRFLLGG
jgi:superfamily II DNA or RNA helicase